MKYFNENDTLLNIINKYPETITVFVNNGFSQMENFEKREKFGKSISLKMALTMKHKSIDNFSKLLIDAIEETKSSNINIKADENSISVVGLLPCPVRLPLLEGFQSFVDQYSEQTGITVNHELKAASMGLDWVEKNLIGIEDSKQLPDLFISAGFDMFFNENIIGKFKKKGVFEDTSKIKKFNKIFDKINLKDPRKHYGMIGVVPAVFLVNTKELGELEMPKSWKDLMKPEFENKVSLPVGDFDLFNAILLNIHKEYGDIGVKKLANSLLESMHPSEMLKSDRKSVNRPIVTIMPYFFTRITKLGGVMEAVWPEDGAIISPIFILAKKEKIKNLQPIIDFFESLEVGEILSHKGLFPSVHPDIDNKIPENNKMMWLDWNYIYSNDINNLIKHCEFIFNKALKVKSDTSQLQEKKQTISNGDIL